MGEERQKVRGVGAGNRGGVEGSSPRSGDKSQECKSQDRGPVMGDHTLKEKKATVKANREEKMVNKR